LLGAMDCAVLRRRMAHWALALTSITAPFGCRPPEPPPFPNHLAGYETEATNPGFGLMREAGERAFRDADALLYRTRWTPGLRARAIAKAQPALAILRRAHRETFEFVYSPQPPLSEDPARSGWRFLGTTLLWAAQDALEAGDGDRAVTEMLTLFRLSWDLMGGDALDANLGYTFIRNAQAMLWEGIARLSPQELMRLSRGIETILERAPSVHQTLRHEEAAMLSAVQLIQDAFLGGGLDTIADTLQGDTAPAFDYLRALRGKPQEEQVEYFRRFAQEARDRIRALHTIASEDTSQWRSPQAPSGERPWRRLAAQFFGASDRILHQWLYSLTVTRLIAVDARLLSRLKSGARLPASLDDLPQVLRTDPYSGTDFLYHNLAVGYDLYSVGENRKDDRGLQAPGGELADIAAPPRS
jgi:hypothetical protein